MLTSRLNAGYHGLSFGIPLWPTSGRPQMPMFNVDPIKTLGRFLLAARSTHDSNPGPGDLLSLILMPMQDCVSRGWNARMPCGNLKLSKSEFR